MKLINEKGKLFGIINVIDFLVLLIILVAAVGIGWKLLGAESSQDEVSHNPVTITYVVRAKNQPIYLADSISTYEGELPLSLVSGDSYVENAQLVSIDTVPTTIVATDSEGTVSRETDPGVVDILFTCTYDTTLDSPIITMGSQELRVGMSHTLKTSFFEVSTTIESITFEERTAE